MNNTAGGVRLGDDVIGVIEEMFLRLRFVLHGKQRKDFLDILLRWMPEYIVHLFSCIHGSL